MTNRAFRIHSFGSPEVLRADEFPIPEPLAGEVQAAALPIPLLTAWQSLHAAGEFAFNGCGLFPDQSALLT